MRKRKKEKKKNYKSLTKIHKIETGRSHVRSRSEIEISAEEIPKLLIKSFNPRDVRCEKPPTMQISHLIPDNLSS